MRLSQNGSNAPFPFGTLLVIGGCAGLFILGVAIRSLFFWKGPTKRELARYKGSLPNLPR